MNRLADHVGVGLAGRALLEGHHAFFFAGEGARRVKVHRVVGGRLKAVTLFGHHVQQHRAGHILDHRQVLAQLRNAVAVDRADVAEAELLEEHAAVQAGLDRFLDLRQEPLGRVAQQRHLVEHLEHFALQAGVERVDAQPVEILAHAADAGADRHLVVVQDHQQVLAQTAGVVHRLVDDARGKRAVADHGHGVAVFLAGHAGRRHSSGPARSRRCSRHGRS